MSDLVINWVWPTFVYCRLTTELLKYQIDLNTALLLGLASNIKLNRKFYCSFPFFQNLVEHHNPPTNLQNSISRGQERKVKVTHWTILTWHGCQVAGCVWEGWAGPDLFVNCELCNCLASRWHIYRMLMMMTHVSHAGLHCGWLALQGKRDISALIIFFSLPPFWPRLGVPVMSSSPQGVPRPLSRAYLWRWLSIKTRGGRQVGSPSQPSQCWCNVRVKLNQTCVNKIIWKDRP